MATRQVGRDAGTGKFIPVEKARRDKEGAIVERVKVPASRPKPKPKGK